MASLKWFLICVNILLIRYPVCQAGQQAAFLQNLDTLEKFRQQIILPVVVAPNCTLNACEALKLVSQLLVLLQSSLVNPLQKLVQGAPTTAHTNSLQSIDDYDGVRLQKMVRQIESRLRSVEQPVWRLALGSRLEWNHCTSSACRCNPDTKSFTCWNTNLKSVPVTQVIPMNMVSM